MKLCRIVQLLTVAALISMAGLANVSTSGAADSHALIQGSGSSWAANAVNQWVADVASQGIQVVYTPDGDAQGRQDFANKTSDFSVTSIGYQGVDPVTGVSDTSQGRDYAYLPIAAGGTAFPYQIILNGKQVRNLRLSGETLAKIFTNQITNWDDPEITKDNNGVALPSLPITPVVQSEGSGATAQLTRYFATEYPTIWNAFAPGQGMTEYFPRAGNQIAQNGSNAAMNYVASSQANGSIGYVEYSFALSVNYPVVKMLNTAGYYTLPTQYNVAVALEKAVINMDPTSPDYLLQNLDNVYVDPDPRTYPLSSYVYMIEPTGAYPTPETNITTAKRQSIADFEYYAICQGQREIGPIGYSPLPVNLVEAGFGQIDKLKAADPNIDLTQRNILTCGNPTFVEGHPDANYLAQIAPMPQSCDKLGAGPCTTGQVVTTTTTTAPTTTTTSTTTTTTVPVTTTTTKGHPPTTTTTVKKHPGGGGATTTTLATTTTTVPSQSTTTTTVPNTTTTTLATTTTTVSSGTSGSDPNTGQVYGPSGSSGVSESLGVENSPSTTAELAPLAVVALLALLIVPPLVALRLRRRRPK
jgi:ABC-type phosphate transport system substrate-binding protein